jgi:hypothetical protein
MVEIMAVLMPKTGYSVVKEHCEAESIALPLSLIFA